MKKAEIFLSLTILLITGLLVGSVYTSGFQDLGLDLFGRSDDLNEEQIRERTQAFIVNSFEVNPDTLSFTSISKENGVYKIEGTTAGQEFYVFMALNGSMFFPSGYPVTDAQVAGVQDSKEFTKSDKPEVKLFTMSFCPYGNIAENALSPVAGLLGDAIDLRVHYIINQQGSSFSSLHGQVELDQDLRERCVYENDPDNYWSFLEKVNAYYDEKGSSYDGDDFWSWLKEELDRDWSSLAEGVGIDSSVIEKCFSDNFENYAQEEVSISLQYQANSSPTLLINGTSYEGSRTPEAYKQAICSAFNEPPASCETVLASEGSTASGTCN